MSVQNMGLGSTSTHFQPTNGPKIMKWSNFTTESIFGTVFDNILMFCGLFQGRKTDENELSVFISIQIPVQNMYVIA